MESLAQPLNKALRVGLSIILAVTLGWVFPTSALADNDASQSSTNTEDSEDTTQESDYTNQYLKDLLANDQLSYGSNTTITADEKLNGVFVTGTAGELAQQGITVTKKLNFDNGTVSRIRVQALTERKSKASIAVYLDDQSDPIATFKINAQKKVSSWDVGSKDYCKQISDLNITGEHAVTLKITDTGKKDEEAAPKVFIQSFEFMDLSVPLLNFNIDESLGTVESMNSSSDHSAECYGSFDITVPDNYVSEYTGKAMEGGSYSLDYIRGRGNSTWIANTTHKPYKIKLDSKANLLGMGKNKNWVLIANYYDNSQLRNKISYWLSEQLGFEFTVKLEPVEVIMNGEYYGSYYLCQQVRVGKNNLNIDDLEDSPNATDADTISGGYLLNLGGSTDETQGFSTQPGDSSTVDWEIESPSFTNHSTEAQQAQYNYIYNYITETEDALYSSDFKNSSGKRYTDYLDLQSAVDFLWMQEFSMNGDAYTGGSNYLYKKRNGKLYFGPVWDFDYVAWGSIQYDKLVTTGWSQKNEMWVPRLLDDDEFVNAFIERWQTLKAAVEELTKSGGKLDQFASRIAKAANYSIEKYGMTNLDETSEYDGKDDGGFKELSFQEEVERLRTWITQRETWVDQHVDQLTPIKCTVTFKDGTKTLSKSEAYVGESLVVPNEEDAPTKAGYTFLGWKLSYHVSYERYLKANRLTEEEFVNQVGATEAAKVKKNGYTYNSVTNESYEVNIPCDLTLTAVYKSNSSNTSGLGSIVTQKGVQYQVTGTSSKSGRTVKVVGVKSTKSKKVTIPVSIKIKGKKYTVTEIGSKAFAGCKKLKRVVIKGKRVYVRNTTFKATNKKCVVKVPRKGLKHYKAAIKSRKVRKL